MKLRLLAALGVLVTALAAPVPAAANTYAYAVYDGYTNMRAGPGSNYPIVARVRGGSRVYIIGCLAGYSWCESVVQGVQGWISATRLEFLYGGRRVYVPEYYAYFGAPIITFGGYFHDDDYYRPNRPPNYYPHPGETFTNPYEGQWRRRHQGGRNQPDIVERPGGTGGGGGGGGGPLWEAPGFAGGGGGGGQPRPGGGGGGCPAGVVCE